MQPGRPLCVWKTPVDPREFEVLIFARSLYFSGQPAETTADLLIGPAGRETDTR
jgi:hypothetical protein